MSQKSFIQSGSYLIDEVKRRAEIGSKHFFDKDTMRFFSSRISELAWQKNGSNDPTYKTKPIYFITSEADQSFTKHKGSIRAFTVRTCDQSGDIKMIGDFQGHKTLMDARKSIKEILEK